MPTLRAGIRSLIGMGLEVAFVCTLLRERLAANLTLVGSDVEMDPSVDGEIRLGSLGGPANFTNEFGR